MDDHKPPKADEVEVSLFGPGIGECVIVHLARGEWIVVDSCIERRSNRPIALDYLDRLGVDVSKCVKLVVVSHWHDDHISGIANVLRVAESAKFVCSAALRSKEFVQAVVANKNAMMESPGIAEFADIFEILQERSSRKVRAESIGPVWSVANQCLLRRENANGEGPTEIYSLSPSHSSLTLAFREIAQLLPQPGMPKRRPIALSPNKLAVVLWILVGQVRVLLGSDLEESPDPTGGWTAIIQSDARPSGCAKIFKVPHHGSENADKPQVWTEMLEPRPFALVSPFASGRRPLPSPSDIARLSGRTQNLYCTANPNGWSPPRRDNAVEKAAKEVTRCRRAIRGTMGHIRIRVRASELPPSIRPELFNGAYRAAV